MYPHLFDIGPLAIKSYGLLVALGFLLGISWANLMGKKLGISSEMIMDVSLISMIGGVLGARLFYVLINWPYFATNWQEILLVQHGGLVLYGGLITAITANIIYLRRKKAPLWEIADLAGPTILLGQTFGRLGCFFNGCCYGLPTVSFWGLHFPPGSGAYFQYPEQAVFPLQLLTAGADFLLFLFLWWQLTRRHFRGQIFGLYGILYAGLRFSLEFFRGDEERGFYGPLSTSQWLSVAFFICFASFYLARQKQAQKQKREK